MITAAQPPATASYKSSKPTLIPWELQKIHPTYVPSRIPTYTFEFIDGGLAYGEAQGDGYHPESMPGYHEFRRTSDRETSQPPQTKTEQQQQQQQQQQPQAQQRKTEVPLEVSEQEKERVENVTVEQSNEES